MSDTQWVIDLFNELLIEINQLNIQVEILEDRIDEVYERLDFEINDIRDEYRLLH